MSTLFSLPFGGVGNAKFTATTKSGCIGTTCSTSCNKYIHTYSQLLKNSTCGGKTTLMHCIKKTLLRRSRKPLNLYLTHTQQHHSPCENDHDRSQALDLCFSVRQTNGFFNPNLKFASMASRYLHHLTNPARSPFTILNFTVAFTTFSINFRSSLDPQV
jgi:hypothetical protein